VLGRHWLNQRAINKLETRASVRWRRFARSSAPLASPSDDTLRPEGDATHLFKALEQTLGSAAGADTGSAASDTSDSAPPPGPVLILSDGHDTQRTAAPQLAARLNQAGRRVFAAAFGRAGDADQLSVQAWPDSDRVFEGDAVTLTADVRHRGYEGRTVRVTLTRGRDQLDARTLTLNQNISRPLTFDIEPTTAPGEGTTTRVYQVSVAPVDGASADSAPQPEQSNEQRQTPVFVTVSKERVQVLLLEGEPYWDTRAFARVLRSHPRIALSSIHRLGADRRVVARQGEAVEAGALDSLDLPTLKRFDVVALGKRIDRFFSPGAADRLTRYVRQGGALVLVRGRPVDAEAIGTEAARSLAQSLEPILPVTWGETVVRDLRLSLTPAGRESPLFSEESASLAGDTVLTRLPRMLAATRVARAKAASIVTLQQQPRGEGAPPMAGLAHMRAGQGRVLAVLSEGLWRWPMRGGEAGGQTALATFWSRAVQWLAAGGEFLPGQNLSLELSPRQARAGEAVTIALTSRYPLGDDVSPKARITGPDGQTQTVTLTRAQADTHRFTASYRPAEAGVARVAIDPRGLPADDDAPPDNRTAPRGRVVVRPASVEQADTTPRPEVLERLTRATGGEMLPTAGVDRLADHLDALRAARQRAPELRYSFDHWAALALIALSLASEWAWRQRTGG
jgi:hypothetical protein